MPLMWMTSDNLTFIYRRLLVDKSRTPFQRARPPFLRSLTSNPKPNQNPTKPDKTRQNPTNNKWKSIEFIVDF